MLNLTPSEATELELKIGFTPIREWLSDFCAGSIAKEKVNDLVFLTDLKKITILQEQIYEWLKLKTIRHDLPSFTYADVSKLVYKLSITGGFLIEDEWVEVRKTLENINTFQRLFEHPETVSLFHLRDLSFDIRLDKNLVKEINVVIDEDGRVRSNASPELKEIREQLFAEQNKLRKKLTSLLTYTQKEGMSDEEMTLTVRNGRIVIPLKAEYKRKIKGLVHDESATGQTVFIEPEEALESNNLIKELEYAEKREIVKILSRLGDRIKPNTQEIIKGLKWIGELDFIQAKSKLALLINAQKPTIVPQPKTRLRNAYHPVLLVNHNESKKKTIPLNLEMDETNRLIVVSGPNAGGKSVSLKTVGLLQYMFQNGLPISASEASEFGIYHHIFADIGDAQSLENDLSTYSSHLLNLKKLLVIGNEKTLLLIDEFGAGTDPEYGGAIAEAILEALVDQRCKGVINTHYTNLKLFAQKQDGLINAAMRFDPIKLEPLYELETGKPGSSFALEIAKKIGLSQHVIEKAKSKIGKNRLEEDQLLVELEKKKAELEENSKKIAAKEKSLKEATAQYEELRNLMSETKNKFINDAKIEAQQIILNANKLIESTIREIKENNAEKEKTQELRKSLEIELEKIKPKPQQPKPALKNLDISTLSVGDQVRIIGQEALGEVSTIKGENVEVTWGELKTFVKKNKLEKVSNRQLKKELKTVQKPKLTGVDITEKMSNFRSEYDFRGLRAEEALNALDQIMDDVLLLGVSEFKIVHGKGDGILRQVLRKKLKEFREVSGIKDEHPDRGGDGASIITMK